MEILEVIKEFMSENRIEGEVKMMKDVFVFFNTSSVPLSFQALNRIFNKFCEELNVDDEPTLVKMDGVYYLIHKGEKYPLFKEIQPGEGVGLKNLKAIFALYRKLAYLFKEDYDGYIPIRFSTVMYYVARLRL